MKLKIIPLFLLLLVQIKVLPMHVACQDEKKSFGTEREWKNFLAVADGAYNTLLSTVLEMKTDEYGYILVADLNDKAIDRLLPFSKYLSGIFKGPDTRFKKELLTFWDSLIGIPKSYNVAPIRPIDLYDRIKEVYKSERSVILLKTKKG